MDRRWKYVFVLTFFYISKLLLQMSTFIVIAQKLAEYWIYRIFQFQFIREFILYRVPNTDFKYLPI